MPPRFSILLARRNRACAGARLRAWQVCSNHEWPMRQQSLRFLWHFGGGDGSHRKSQISRPVPNFLGPIGPAQCLAARPAAAWEVSTPNSRFGALVAHNLADWRKVRAQVAENGCRPLAWGRFSVCTAVATPTCREGHIWAKGPCVRRPHRVDPFSLRSWLPAAPPRTGLTRIPAIRPAHLGPFRRLVSSRRSLPCRAPPR